MQKHIVLIGPMGCGKTTVGEHLAALFKIPFYDTDSIICREQKLSISQIFNSFGVTYFRGLELKLIRNLVNAKSGVIACGGGSVLQPLVRSLLKSRGKIFYLKTAHSTRVQRLRGQCASRPYLATAENWVMESHKIYSTRKELYNLFADVTIYCGTMEAKSIVGQIHKYYNGNEL